MAKLLLISGVILFIGSIILIAGNYEKFTVERHGQVVAMQIKDMPKSCVGAKVRYFVIYSYNGERYDKATRGDFCEKHYIGETVNMKMFKGSKYILYPNESALKSLVSFAVLGIFGLVLFILQWKKLRHDK